MLSPFFYNGRVPRTSAIYLIGMTGVGKSTIGAELAARLGRVFLDSDQEVERRTGRSISEIFSADGEAAFRMLEAEVIASLAMDGAVIALGGGASVQPGAMDRLLESGEVIFLEAAPAVLLKRIGDSSSRPLLAGLDGAGRIDKLASLLAERLPSYRLARIHVDAEGATAGVVDRIVDELAAA